MGPGDDQCIDCEELRDCPGKCQHYSFEERCLSDCDAPGLFYASNTTCGKCHEQCLDSCTGPVSLRANLVYIV